MYCRRCGAQLADTAKFCTKCGEQVALVEDDAAEEVEAVTAAPAAMETGAAEASAGAAEAPAAAPDVASVAQTAAASAPAEPSCPESSAAEPALPVVEPPREAVPVIPAVNAAQKQSGGKKPLVIAGVVALAAVVVVAAIWIGSQIANFTDAQHDVPEQEEAAASVYDNGAGDAASGAISKMTVISEGKLTGEAKNAVDAYRSLLDNATDDSWTIPDADQGDGSHFDYPDAKPKDTGYAYVDVTGDSVPELLLSEKKDGVDRIVEMATYFNGEIHELECDIPGDDDGFEILEDGRLACKDGDLISFGTVLPTEKWCNHVSDPFADGRDGEEQSIVYGTVAYNIEGGVPVKIANTNKDGFGLENDSMERVQTTQEVYDQAKKDFEQTARAQISWSSFPVKNAGDQPANAVEPEQQTAPEPSHDAEHADDGESDDATERNQATASASSENEKAHKAYEKPIANYRKAIKDSNYDWNKNKYDVNTAALLEKDDWKKDFEYAYVDLNGDGVDELLIGSPDHSPEGKVVGTGSDFVFDAYAFSGGEAKSFLSGMDRDNHRLSEGGVFVHRGSGGAYSTIIEALKLKSPEEVEAALSEKAGNSYIPEEKVFDNVGASYGVDGQKADGSPKYYRCDKRGGKQKSISKKEFKKGRDALPTADKSVKWTKICK